MRLIDISSVDVTSRQRKTIDKASIRTLAESILNVGLLHPPVVSFNATTQRYDLVAGETRLRAIQQIKEQGALFFCDTNPIVGTELPVTLISELSPLELLVAQFEENEIRQPLDWKDRTEALAEIHRMRKAENPAQTFRDTGKELNDRIPEEARVHITTAQRQVEQAVVIAAHMDDEAVSKARNATEAYRIALNREAVLYEAELVKRRRASALQISSVEIRHGDARKILPQIDAGTFDLLFADPPYGVNASSGGFRSRTVHHHNYDDSPENARDLLQLLLTEGFRICKPKANFMVFGDMALYEFFQQATTRMGWVPWRYPIIWRKSASEGLAPWGSAGFAHTYDVIFWATKGQRGLNRLLLDVLDFPRVSRKDRVYAAEKPIPLIRHLIEALTRPGDSIIDPCCGSGTTLIAAKQMARNGLGIELDKSVADLALVRVNQATAQESSTDANTGHDLDPNETGLGDIPD